MKDRAIAELTERLARLLAAAANATKPIVTVRHGSDGLPAEVHPACHPTVARIRAARLGGGLGA